MYTAYDDVWPPRLNQVLERLSRLNVPQMREMLRSRLIKDPVEDIPQLGREEDPTDVLVATYKMAIAEHREDELYSLPLACKSLAEEWSDSPRAVLMRNPEPLGELLYLCARIGAQDAADSVARVAGR